MTPGGTGRLAGHPVAHIGHGAMQLRRLHDRSAAVALLRRAVDLGVDHVDTAQFYGAGFVNEVIGEALLGTDDVVVVSKVGGDADPDGPHPVRLAQRPDQLRASVEDNLATLGLDRIPVVNLRLAGAGPIRPDGDQLVDLDDQLAELVGLRAAGKIGAFGLSGVAVEDLRRALPAGIACVQNAYSLVDRLDEEALHLCTEQGVAWVPYFPLGGAAPGLPKVTDQPAVLAAAAATGRTPAQIGLAWLLHRAPNVLLILGTADADHLAANLAAGDVTADELAGLLS